MKRHVVVVTIVLAATAGVVFGQGSRNWRAALSGYNETPSATAPGTISTVARGRFSAHIDRDDPGKINWSLSYQNLEGLVTQAHIHFGAVGTSGGISVFLCTNLNNSPGTQACPQEAPPDDPVTGSFTATDVIGPAAQGIAAGEFAELLRAIRAGHTYANVHSQKFPSGEVRGALLSGNRGNNDDDDNEGHGH